MIDKHHRVIAICSVDSTGQVERRPLEYISSVYPVTTRFNGARARLVQPGIRSPPFYEPE